MKYAAELFTNKLLNSYLYVVTPPVLRSRSARPPVVRSNRRNDNAQLNLDARNYRAGIRVRQFMVLLLVRC
jgi:hypothetical protein